MTPKKTQDQLNVLVADETDFFPRLFSSLIVEATGADHEPRIFKAADADLIYRTADAHCIDLFILILNNIRHGTTSMPAPTRLGHSLDLMRQLKERSGKPIIALSDLHGKHWLWERAHEAGADYFFPLPFKVVHFKEAVAACLVAA